MNSKTKVPERDHVKLDAEISAINKELRELEAQPVSIGESIQKLLSDLDAEAADGEQILRKRLNVCEISQVELNPRGASTLAAKVKQIEDRQKIDGFLLRDIRRSALEKLATILPGGISTADREKEREKLAAKRLELEIAREELVRSQETVGITIPRRADADVRLVLDLKPNGSFDRKRLERLQSTYGDFCAILNEKYRLLAISRRGAAGEKEFLARAALTEVQRAAHKSALQELEAEIKRFADEQAILEKKWRAAGELLSRCDAAIG
jgi:hypothetical protein